MMDFVSTVQAYVARMVSSTVVPGIKVLLLDDETMGIVSLIYSRTQILHQQVYLIDKIANIDRLQSGRFKCIVFIRPTPENQKLLCQELQNPKYDEYFLYNDHADFSNTISAAYIERLAVSDEREVVSEVHEFFADYFPLHADLVTLNLPGVLAIRQQDWTTKLGRTIDGLTSMLLSLKKQPSIRYVAKSALVQAVCTELQKRINAESSLFQFRKQDPPPVLVLLDRREDPITPLMTPWTYEAMIHDLLMFTNGRVRLTGVNEEELVLHPEQDLFYKQHMFKNFGELGVAIQTMMDAFMKGKNETTSTDSSLEEIQRLVERLPEVKAEMASLSKHVNVLSELSRLIAERDLFGVSALEQLIPLSQKLLKQMLGNPKIRAHEMVKLVMLYVIKYEDRLLDASELKRRLHQRGVPIEQINLIDAIKSYAGAHLRTTNLFGSRNTMMSAFRINEVARSLRGVANIYAEHTPQLHQVLEALTDNKLSENDYPFLTGSRSKNAPTDVILFMIGGATYAESMMVTAYNKQHPKVCIVLGATTMHSSASFMKDLELYHHASS